MQRAMRMLVGSLTIALIAQPLYWYSRMPERMASHFDMSNYPDGWMSRTSFIALSIGVALLMGGIFVLIPLFVTRLPIGWINMPNKDYWLAPERRARSLELLNGSLLIIGCASQLLFLVIFHSIYVWNLEHGGAEGPSTAPLSMPLPFWAVIGAYLLLVAVVVGWMLRRFRVPTR